MDGLLRSAGGQRAKHRHRRALELAKGFVDARPLGDGRLTPLIVATIAVQVGGEFAAATPCCSAITLPKAPFRVLESELGKSYISMAMNTGHDGSLTTIHGNSPRDALDRLATLAMMAGERLAGEELVRMVSRTIELVVQLRVTMRTGQRRIASIFEVTGVEGGVISGHEIWGLEHGRLVWKGRPPRCLDKMAAHGIEYAPPLGLAAEGLA